MPLNPAVDIAAQLAIALSGVYLDPDDKTTSLLAALFGAVKSYNESNGKPPGYIPSKQEWEAEAEAREAKRIPKR